MSVGCEPRVLRVRPPVSPRLSWRTSGLRWRLVDLGRGRLLLTVGFGALAVALGALAVRHFAETSWPLASGAPALLVAVGVLFVCASAFKAYGWQRLFAAGERPQTLALAAANGGASVLGVALPGRFDDVVRVAIVRRYPGCPVGVRGLCLSLVMLGLIDSVALAPLAFAAVAFPGLTVGLRAGLALVGAAGVAAAALIVVFPHLAASRRVLRFRLGRWLCPRTTSLRAASQAWALVTACWLVRAVALCLLLGVLGLGYSFTLALLFLCAGAAAAALPIGPAAAATQAGAGAAVLIASGVGASQALSVTVASQALGVLASASILVFATLWRGSRRLMLTRVTA
jgi:Lysylphosphatidylglycerol synthase TM region